MLSVKWEEKGVCALIAQTELIGVCLSAENGIIKSDRVYEVMLTTDRAHYSRCNPYMDSPQSIGMHGAVEYTDGWLHIMSVVDCYCNIGITSFWWIMMISNLGYCRPSFNSAWSRIHQGVTLELNVIVKHNFTKTAWPGMLYYNRIIIRMSTLIL